MKYILISVALLFSTQGFARDFKMTILKADNSVYWVEHFRSLDDAVKWVDIEKTRPYWKAGFSYNTVEIVPPVFDQAKLDALETALTNQRTGLRAALANVDTATIAQLRQMVKSLIRLQLRE